MRPTASRWPCRASAPRLGRPLPATASSAGIPPLASATCCWSSTTPATSSCPGAASRGWPPTCSPASPADCPPTARRLAAALPHPPRLAGNLLRNPPLPRHLLPHGELDPSRPDPGSRQARCPPPVQPARQEHLRQTPLPALASHSQSIAPQPFIPDRSNAYAARNFETSRDGCNSRRISHLGTVIRLSTATKISVC